MPASAKIRALRAGKKVKPPYAWFNKILRRLRKMRGYKGYSAKRLQTIAAGIWHGYGKATQIGIIRAEPARREKKPRQESSKPYKGRYDLNSADMSLFD